MNYCQEVIRTYFGENVIADCYLQQLGNGDGVLKYYFKDTWDVDGLILHPPMYTLGYYSEHKPYNVYCWFNESDKLVAYYFNIVDQTKLRSNVFEFRDLIVDVLVYPDLQFSILDEDEIPGNMDNGTADLIYNTKDYLINRLDKVIAEVERAIKPFSGQS